MAEFPHRPARRVSGVLALVILCIVWRAVAAPPAGDPPPAQPAATSKLRAWKDRSGRFSLEARLERIDAGTVWLRTADGRTFKIARTQLSASDRAFLAGRAAARATGAKPELAKPGKKRVRGTLRGRVVAIADGDTLTVLDAAKRQHKVRLEGIDAPERGQPFGDKARKALGQAVFSKSVRVATFGKDKYGRTLGHIYLKDRWINRELVAGGLAWHYRKYSKDRQLAEAERSARSRKAGLWSDATPVAPWEWRKLSPRERAARVSGRAGKPAPSEKTAAASASKKPSAAARYWLNTSSNVRHNARCRWFGATKRGRYCSASDGKACKRCGG